MRWLSSPPLLYWFLVCVLVAWAAGCARSAAPDPSPGLEGLPAGIEEPGGQESNTPGPAQAQYWEPFLFQPGQYFKYEISSGPRDGTWTTGWFSVDFVDAQDGHITARWQGEMDGGSFSSTLTAPSEDVMAHMLFGLMMQPSAAPVVSTLLAPWWGIFFVGHSWELGAGWSFRSDLGSSSFEIVELREYAGVQGYLGRWVEDGSLKAEVCVAPGVPLALYVRMEKDAEIQESRLVEYRPSP
ncbi:MAG: hypothetical protein AB1576_10215 [Bacillota bacterium]